jgi:hypothetical protein
VICGWLRAACALVVLILPAAASAQVGAIEGRVRAVDGAAVASASVTLHVAADAPVDRSTETDALGRFRLLGLAPGRWFVRAASIGYAPADTAVEVRAGEVVSLEMAVERQAVDLPGVAVEVDRRRARFETDAGVTAAGLAREELKRVPGVAEADVLRAVEVLPGVVSTSDFSSAFNVRGGSADQNLIVLDGFPVYNPFHLGGLFSVFNADMVARAELLAGGFPVEYGGRVASVLKIESDASGEGTDVRAGASLLATRVALGAALPEALAERAGLSTARARVSVRRSYFDVLFSPFFDFPYHLTDLQLFAEGWTPGGARISLTGYTGRDVLDLAGVDSFPLQVRWNWGNDVIGLRYTMPLDRGRLVDARFGVSRFSTALRFPEFGDTQFGSEVTHAIARLDAVLPAGSAEVRGGIAADRLAYDNLAVSGGTVFREGKEHGWLFSGYAQALLRPESWLIELGARLDAWRPAGAGQPITAVSPRLAVKRFLSDDVALKMAVGRFTQFIHSLRDEELPLGIDIWVLTGERAPHVVSDQVQLGVEAFLPHGWFAGAEAYYRTFTGVVTNNFADDPNDRLDDLIAGDGLSYGVDLQLSREQGRVRPTVAVSWLKATREFADPTRGVTPAPLVEYPPVFDRRLEIELMVQALLPGESEAGIRWNFGTGLPYTRPLGGYTTLGYRIVDEGRRSADGPTGTMDISVVLSERNRERYPTYHRLDLSVRRTFRPAWGRVTPYIDVLNLYNQRNPLFYFYEFDETPPTRSGISMFPLLPTLGVEVVF